MALALPFLQFARDPRLKELGWVEVLLNIADDLSRAHAGGFVNGCDGLLAVWETVVEGMEPYDTEAALGRFGGHGLRSFEDTAPEYLTAAHGLDVGVN